MTCRQDGKRTMSWTVTCTFFLNSRRRRMQLHIDVYLVLFFLLFLLDYFLFFHLNFLGICCSLITHLHQHAASGQAAPKMSLNRVSSLESFSHLSVEGHRRSPSPSSRDRRLSFNPLPESWDPPTSQPGYLESVGAFEVPKWKRVCKSECTPSAPLPQLCAGTNH